MLRALNQVSGVFCPSDAASDLAEINAGKRISFMRRGQKLAHGVGVAGAQHKNPVPAPCTARCERDLRTQNRPSNPPTCLVRQLVEQWGGVEHHRAHQGPFHARDRLRAHGGTIMGISLDNTADTFGIALIDPEAVADKLLSIRRKTTMPTAICR